MSINRYAAKRDAIEPLLERTMARLGMTWVQAGPLDGWVGFRGTWCPVEIKSGKSGRITDSQREFIDECIRLKAPYQVWRSVDDVLGYHRFMGGWLHLGRFHR
jgi:hypothetical protein